VAGGLINEFRAAVDAFFRRHAPDGDLVGMILVGGGAHWPFVHDWAADYVGANNVWRDAFPEQAVARGLPRLAAMRLAPAEAPRPTRSGEVKNGDSTPTRPRPVRPATPGGLAAGPAAVLEFFGGLFGFLGLGWFFGARRVGVGCPALLGWWVVLALLFALGIASAISDRPVLIIPLLLLWLGVPALSATLLHRRSRRASPG
jgi:hypothetical protein